MNGDKMNGDIETVALMIIVFLLIVLFGGDPDLVDSLIFFLMRE